MPKEKFRRIFFPLFFSPPITIQLQKLTAHWRGTSVNYDLNFLHKVFKGFKRLESYGPFYDTFMELFLHLIVCYNDQYISSEFLYLCSIAERKSYDRMPIFIIGYPFKLKTHSPDHLLELLTRNRKECQDWELMDS